jgi:hypothetical protein
MGSYVRRARMGDGEVREPHLSECKGYITLVTHRVGICLSLTGCLRSQKEKFYWVSSAKCHPDLKVGINNWILFLTNPPKNLILFSTIKEVRGRKVSFGFKSKELSLPKVMWNLFGQVCHTCHMGLGNTHCICVKIYIYIFLKIPSTYLMIAIQIDYPPTYHSKNLIPINLYRLAATYK